MRYTRATRLPLGRCGEIVGRASAGFIIVGTVGFALAAMMADFM